MTPQFLLFVYLFTYFILLGSGDTNNLIEHILSFEFNT